MKYLKNKRGNTLVLTVILLMVISTLGMTMMFSITNEIKINKAIEERAIAKYLAQAGIDHALYLIENDDGSMVYPYNEVIVLENNARVYDMTINQDAGLIIISSTGRVEVNGAVKQQVSLQATILEDGRVVVE